MALIVPVAWLLLHNGYPFWTAFICMMVFELLNHACTVWFASKRHGFPFLYFIKDVYLPFVVMTVIACCMVYGGKSLGLGEVESLLVAAGWCVVIELVMLALVAVIVLKRQERELLVTLTLTLMGVEELGLESCIMNGIGACLRHGIRERLKPWGSISITWTVMMR